MKNNLFNRVINRVFAGSLPTVDRRSNYTSSTRHRVACILFVMFFAIPQMWGGTYTFSGSDLIDKKVNGPVTLNFKGVSASEQQIYKPSSAVKANIVQIGNSANNDFDNYCVAISSTEKITSIKINAVNNQSSGNYNLVTTFWKDTPSASIEGYATLSVPNKNSTTEPSAQTITPVDGTKYFRIYRYIYLSSDYKSFSKASGYKKIGDGKTIYVISIEVTTAGSDTPECPENLTISSKDDKTAFIEGEKIELSASLEKGNGEISYQWYKGSVADGNKIADATTDELTIDACALSDAGNYYCVASKADCDDETSDAFAITVAEDPRCAYMPTLTSQPASLDAITTVGMTLSNNNPDKVVEMNKNGIKLGGDAAQLKVTLSSSTIVEGTKITIKSKGGDGTGIGVFNGEMQSQVINATSIKGDNTQTHTFTATESADYADEFIITRNGTGASNYIYEITIENCGPEVVKHTVSFDMNGATSTAIESQSIKDGNKATKPADPTKTMAVFKGWVVASTGVAYDFDAPVTADVALKAKWAALHNITYADVKEEEGAEPESSLPTQYEEGVGVASFANLAGAQGWLFKGWSPASIGTDATEDVTITATWEQVQSHKVTYKPGDGTGLAGGSFVDKGAPVTVAACTYTAPAGKVFRHWTVEGVEVEGKSIAVPGQTFTMPDNVVTLTAYYDVQHTVTFKDGEETISIANVWDNEKLVAPTAPAKPLAEFAGWTKEGVAYVFETPVTEDFTLLATWNKTYAHSYDIEAYVAEHGINDNPTFRADFMSKGYALNSPDDLDTYNYDPSKAFANYPFVGLKFKAVGGGIEANVEAAKLVTIKLGHMAANANLIINDDEANKKSLAGVDAATPKVHYFYSDAEANYKLQMTSGSTCVLKAFLISDPFEVTFSNGGTIDPMTFKGEALTLPEATGEGEFQGWFTQAEGGELIGKNGDLYTPTADIELFAQFSPCSTNNEIVSFQFGETVITATEGKRDYAIELPYKTAIPETLTYTKAEEKASAGNVSKEGNVLSFTVTSECGVPANYTVTFTVAPKDPVCIIHADITGQGAASVDPSKSAYEGTATANSNVKNGTTYEGITGYKFNSEGARMSVTLADGYGSFKAGDVVKMYITTAQAMPIRAYSDENASNEVVTGAANMVQGINSAVLTADASTLWLVRTGTNSWNPNVAYVEVCRPMNPILTKMEIDNRAADVVNNACSIMLPYEADLANLTVNPTIFANKVQSIVINDGEGWKLGDNTYKIIDKDGDESVVYTITLARDVLKYTVTFDVQGGAPAIESQDVVAGETITPVATPEKWDNSFLGWSMNEDPAIVEDITAVAINAATTFKANWGPETGVIKLIDGEGNLNTTDFITGATMAAGVTVQYQGANLPVARLGGTVSAISGVNQLNKVIEYVPTTTKTKMMIVANNNTTSGRKVTVYYVLEGETTASTTTYDLGNKELINTGYVEYNSASRRSIYLTVPSSVSNVDFLQVKVIESGEPLVKVGEPGYSINLNKGRLIAASGADYTFEGITYNLSSGYGCINSVNATTKTYVKFAVENDVQLQVTTNNTSKYYVTKASDGTDNETTPTANVATSFDLTAGTWYIRSAGSGVNLTNIAFAKPNAPKPEITAISEGTYCQGDAMPELTVTASVASGDLHYQWYKVADGGDVKVGENANTYTPDADATYYVVVTNKKEGYNDASEQSDIVEVKSVAGTTIISFEGGEARDGQTITLSVEAEGKNLTYAWFTCDEGGNISGDQLGNGATLQVTIAGADAYYKVLVHSECGEDQSAVVLAKMWVERTQTPVSESTVWDFSKVSASHIELSTSTTPAKNEECVLANIEGVNNNDDFNAQALLFAGQHIGRDGNHVAGNYLKLTTTVPGMITIEFADNGSNNRHVDINGQESEASSGTGDKKTFSAAVDAGEIMIKGEDAGKDNTAYVRIYKVEFTAAEVVRDGLKAGAFGTICWPKDAIAYFGATFYEADYKDEAAHQMYFNELEGGATLNGGQAYLFQATGSKIMYVCTGDEKSLLDETENRGFYGVYERATCQGDGAWYGIYGNKVQPMANGAGVPANRAYIDLTQVPETSKVPAGVSSRRLGVGIPSRGQATGWNELMMNEGATKFIRNNQMFILREGKLFNAQGAKMR